VLEALLALPLNIWLIILGFSLLNYLIRYWRWHLYILKDHGSAFSHIKHSAIYIAGFALTMTPGKAGEAMRTLYLKQQGVAHKTTLAALFVERIMDLLAVLLLALLGLSLLEGGQAQIATIFTATLIVVCVVLVKMPMDKLLTLSFVQNLPAKIQNILKFIAGLLVSANSLLSVKYILLGLLLGLVAWGLEGYGLYLVIEYYGLADNIQTSISSAVAIYSIAVLLGAIAFLPGGLGGTEAAMVFMLMKLGFDAPAATAITFICRLATLWFAIVLGILVMFIMSLLGLKPILQEDAQAV